MPKKIRKLKPDAQGKLMEDFIAEHGAEMLKRFNRLATGKKPLDITDHIICHIKELTNDYSATKDTECLMEAAYYSGMIQNWAYQKFKEKHNL